MIKKQRKNNYDMSGVTPVYSLFSRGAMFLFAVILVFSFSPLKADSYKDKPSCCGELVKDSYEISSTKTPGLSVSCPCCGGICRCNFQEGVPLNNTDVNISPRFKYYEDELDLISSSVLFTELSNNLSDNAVFIQADYGESVPLYILKSSLLFYH